MAENESKTKLTVLLSFIGLIVVNHLVGYIGHYGYDDLHYSWLAHNLQSGELDFSDHFSFRTTLLIITSLSYSLLGVSDLASAIPSMLISILVLWVVFSVLKDKGVKTLVAGLSFTLLSPWFLFFSDKIMPDVYVAFSVVVSLFVIHQYKFKNNPVKPAPAALMLSLALLFGFMSKGTIILILPLLLYIFIADMLLKRNLSFWIYTLIIGTLVLALYFFVIWWITGDVMQRFAAVAGNQYLNLCSYDQQPLRMLTDRITYQFFSLLVLHSMATGFIFVIAGFAGQKNMRIFMLDNSFSFWVVSAVMLLLSSNFSSISVTSYVPMCLDPRHFLFLIPVAAIPAALVFKEFLEKKTYRIPLIIVSGVVTLGSYFLQRDAMVHLYLPLFALIFLYSFFKPRKSFQLAFLVILIVILLVKPLLRVEYAQQVQYRKQKKVFNEYIQNPEGSLIVVSNNAQKRLGEYYQGFQKDSLLTLLNYTEFEQSPPDTGQRVILFLNWYTRYLSGLDRHDLPHFVRNISPDNELLFKDKDLGIAVYLMNDYSTAGQAGEVLLYSKNSFDEPRENWSFHAERLSSEQKYSGRYSMEVSEFSSVFSYPLDSLDLTEHSMVSIRCKVFCYFNNKTTAMLVITVEGRDSTYVWDGIPVNKYIQAYSHWWPVSHELVLGRDVIDATMEGGPVVKTYLWNKDGQKAFIDDFEVTIMGK